MGKNRAGENNTLVILGEPVFSNSPYVRTEGPAGQRHLIDEIRSTPINQHDLYRKLALEYGAILACLVAMGIRFAIGCAHRALIEPIWIDAFKEFGLPVVDLPVVNMKSTMYTRDFVSWVGGKILLVPPGLDVRHFRRNGIKLIQSPYSTGGRLLCRNTVVLATELLDQSEDLIDSELMTVQQTLELLALKGQAPLVPAPVECLRQSKLRVGLVPNPMIFGYMPDGSLEFAPDDHLDRVCGLVEDSKGRLHLIVDPQIQSGYAGPGQLPQHSPRQTLEQYERVCGQLGITMHVPSALAVPLSTGFWQAPNGKVLVTSGDDGVAAILVDLLGEQNVHFTEVPVTYYPAYAKAGIHCLIGEMPVGFVNDLCARQF